MLLNTDMTQGKFEKRLNPGLVDATEKTSAKDVSHEMRTLLCAVGKHKDKEAFIKLFEHFAPRIKSFLMKGGASPEIADELAQETMLVVWNKAESYDPKQAAASTWIFTIARNKRIDGLRKTKHHEMNPADPLLIEDDAPSAAAVTLQNEETQILSEAIKTLPQEQADLIYKSFFEDKSHATIAEETGIPLGTIKSRIRLALERLRRSNSIQDIWQ